MGHGDQYAEVACRMTRLIFNTAQAAEYAICHDQTVRKAAECGELHGSQRTAKGRWKFRRECLDAWMAGEKCEHQALPRAG